MIAISSLMMQLFEPVAVLAERRIIVYENQPGPYYEVDITDNGEDTEVQNEKVTETEDYEIPQEGLVENLMEEDEPVQMPEATEEPIESDEPVSTNEPVSTTNPDPTLDPAALPEETLIPDVSETPLETEQPELETAPLQFKEIEDVKIENEEGFVYEKSIDENIMIYQNQEEPELKQMIISQEPLNYVENGKLKPIDTQLVEAASSEASTYSLNRNQGWKNETNILKSYYPSSVDEGIRFEYNETSLTIRPQVTSDNAPTVQGSQVIYPLEDQVNLRYTVDNGKVSEDIMIYDKNASNTYQYHLSAENGRIVFNENVIVVVDGENKPVIRITAPIAYDANEESIIPALSYAEGMMTVSIDEAWMKSEERVYPIVIDPEYEYFGYAHEGIETSVTSSKANQKIGNPDMEALGWYLPSNQHYHAYLYIGNITNYKDSYSFYQFLPSKVTNELSGKLIKSAMIGLRGGEISKDNILITSVINGTYDITNATYNTRPVDVTEISRTPITTTGSWLTEIDVTEYIRSIVHDGAKNNGVMFSLEDMTGSAKYRAHEYLYIGDSGSTPYTSVIYFDEPEVSVTELNDFSYTLRPFTIYDYETGTIQFTSLGIDGVSPTGSSVSINITQEDETVYSHTASADEMFYFYPDYEVIEDTQNYNTEQVSNWQTSTLASSFIPGNLYTVSLQASKDETTSTPKSTSFYVLKMNGFAVASALAEYYGIEENILLQDNNMSDSLIAPGNILFIRDP